MSILTIYIFGGGEMNHVIDIQSIKKVFSYKQKGVLKTTEAVNGVTLTVKSGEIFGFLGPNGAGKTTTLRMLTTLLSIDEGEAFISGFDIKKQPKEVRRHIGYVGQLGGADLATTGFENLILAGKLYGMNQTTAFNRANELINVFDIGELVNRRVKTYSGGQRRRLEVALGIMHKPEVLFLDEPTTGLDPQNRANLWDQMRKLKDEGTTIFLTTHYLEEADELADALSIMDHGKIVAEGTPLELKKQIADDVVIIKPKGDISQIPKIRQYLLEQSFVREVHVDGKTLHLYVADGANITPRIFELLKVKNVVLESMSLSQPTLDDVFFRRTGRSLRDIGSDKEAAL
jgi:ABC-2 type transport system ATP-binding protein